MNVIFVFTCEISV